MSKKNNDGLNERQRKAAGMLASGMQGKETAYKVGVSHGTLSRWKKLPAFDAYVYELQRSSDEAVIQVAVVARRKALDRATRMLGRLERVLDKMDDGDLRPKDLVDAIRVSLEVYKVTAGQTGIGERPEVTAEDVISQIVSRLQDGGHGELARALVDAV